MNSIGDVAEIEKPATTKDNIVDANGTVTIPTTPYKDGEIIVSITIPRKQPKMKVPE